MGRQTKLIEEENSSYSDIRIMLDELYGKFEDLAEEFNHSAQGRKEKIDMIMSQFYWDLLEAEKTIDENRDDENYNDDDTEENTDNE